MGIYFHFIIDYQNLSTRRWVIKNDINFRLLEPMYRATSRCATTIDGL